MDALDDTARISAEVIDASGQVIAGAPVWWESSDEAVAPVDGLGLVTGLANGTATVTASSTSGGATVSAAAEVTVEQRPAAVFVEPDSVSLAALGDTAVLSAWVADGNGNEVPGFDISWSSSNEAVAQVDGEGTVVSQGNGTTTVTASSGGFSAQAAVLVDQVPSTVVITPEGPSVLSALGDTVRLTAVAADANGHEIGNATQHAEWTSTNPQVASVSSEGLVVARGQGTATIAARVGDANGVKPVTVAQAVAAVTISPSELSFDAVGDTARLTARASDRNGNGIQGARLLWSTSDRLVASVDATGLVTALSGGTATVMASSTSGAATVSATAEVAVEQRPTAIFLHPDSVWFTAFGDRAVLTVRLEDANGFNVPGLAVSWSSSNEAVAPVDSAGAVVARGNGRATITARSSGFGAATFVVVEQVASTVAISPAGPAIFGAIGDTLRLVAAVADANGNAVGETGQQVTWTSSDPEVASVGSTGRVVARAEGTATIEARIGQVSGAKPVTVEQVAASVTIRPSELLLAFPGDTARLTARVSDRNGHDMPNARMVWSSSNRHIASVDTAGLVTALRGGVVQVRARSGPVGATVRVAVDNPERDALVAFYNATNGDDWDNNTNWLSDEPLGSWYGVSTNGQGAVTGLSMWRNRVRGPLPTEIGDLANLVTLYLRNNILSGPIPREVGNLERLDRLDLSYNLLSGSIPAEIGNLAELGTLYLQDNLLTGPIPPALGKLDQLEYLSLASNQLQGGIPAQISALDNLSSLNLSDNRLTGLIPSHLSGLAQLQSLTLSSNLFTGPVPSWLASMSELTSLYLGGNQLTGTIPPSLGNLSGLESLGLGANRLTGAIPPSLGDLPALEHLSLSGNQLTGEIPTSLGNLSRLESLYLYANQLGGRIPSSLGGLSALVYLYLNGNQLTGPIPQSLGSLSALETLLLSGNELTGAIPQSLSNLSALRSLYLDRNQLTGAIPASLGDLSALEYLYLYSNQLTGAVPADLGNLSALEWLYIGYNQGLRGSLPRSFLNLGRLRRIEFQYTGVCAPDDDEFQAWLTALRSGHSGSTC